MKLPLYLYFILLFTIFLSTSCVETLPNKSVNNSSEPFKEENVSEEKVIKELYILRNYISRKDTIDLSFKDSLMRYFYTDSNSVTYVVGDRKRDSVTIFRTVEAILLLPINENLRYTIHFDNSPGEINDVINYDIDFLDSNVDSNAFLTFEKYSKEKFSRNIIETTSRFTKKREQVTLSFIELMN